MVSCNVIGWCMLNCTLQSWSSQFNKHFFFQQWKHVVSGLNVRLHVTLEDGHLPTAGKTQGLGSLTEPTCVFVGMLGGASSLVTTTKRVVTTVDGAATQAGAEKWVIVAPFMRLKQTFGDGFYLQFQPPPPAVQPSRSSISPLTQNLPELDKLITYIKASTIL